MALRYPPFLSSSMMIAASRNAPPLRWGARGTAVRLLQGGLIQLGFPLPYSTLSQGVPDGIFGDDTRRGVTKFQEKHKAVLKVDGVAGKNTIELMDALLVAASTTPPAPPPPKPAAPTTVEYQLGAYDPAVPRDPGAGRWNSSPKEAAYIALGTSIVAALPVAYGVIGDDAAKHLIHYFGNRGSTYTIDLDAMVREVPTAREMYEDEVAQAKQFVELLPPGRHEITSRQTQDGYNEEHESRNWYFAIGGYHVWGRGVAAVTERSGGRECDLDFEYKFFDRYNWDNGKSVTIAGQTITDKFMGEFHRQGLAQEFDCVGSFRRRFIWKAGTPIPQGQLHTAGGRA